MNRKKDYRDMEKYRRTSAAQKRRYYGKTTNAENRMQPWTVRELEAILERSKTDTELSQEIGRSVRAIQVARSKALKRIGGSHAEGT